jgi:Putative MetA-pathway of phenol degradation
MKATRIFRFSPRQKMTKRTLQLLLLALASSFTALAQVDCANSRKLVCQIPFSTGIYTNNGSAPSQQQARNVATSFNSAIATQVSQLPLASASSGAVLVYTNGVAQIYDNLGPILTDRAETVGKNRLFLAFTASQFYFTDIDGIGLKNVPFAYQSIGTDKDGKVLSYTYTGQDLDIHFKINQYTLIGTYGISKNLDASIIVPIERVSIGSATLDVVQYLLDGNNNFNGLLHPPSTFSPGIASGVGDITFNAKYSLWRTERARLALGFNLRTPTGDALNYLGSGAWGSNPYAVFSYLAKTSPHVRLGYQWNSGTDIYPNPAHAGTNLSLPGGLQYDVGVDQAVLKRLTVAADLLGNQYLNAPRLTNSLLTFPCTGCSKTATSVSLHTVDAVNSSYWINDVSAGAKWNPWKELILTGNVLFQLNNVGMRARPTPLFGISYKFDFSSKPASKAP